MKYKISTLPNNLKVVTAEMPEAYSATVSVAVGVGSRYENLKDNNGVSHFIEHLLFKGTKNRPSTRKITQKIDAVGGKTNAYTNNEMTDFFVRVPYQHIEIGMDVISDMVQNPLFDPVEIDKERNVVLEEMNVYLDDPSNYVHTLTPRLLWPDHPISYEILGTEDVIRYITPENIRQFHSKYYQPGNMVVSCAGRVKHEDMVKLAEKYFGDMKDENIEPFNKVGKKLSKRVVSEFEKDTAQTHMVIASRGYSYSSKNAAAANVLATILGGGLSSRLFETVREKKGLAYTIWAHTGNFIDTGEFEIYAGVNNNKAPEAIEAIIEELVKIANHKVGPVELNKAKQQLSGSLQMAMENNMVAADRGATQLLLTGKVKSVEQTLAEIEKVTSEKVQEVAQEILSLDRLRLGIISPDPQPAATRFVQLTSK